MTYFPNVVIRGNQEKPTQNGQFDVYLRGVGTVEHRDNQGRFYLYKRQQMNGAYPTGTEIIDKITILAL